MSLTSWFERQRAAIRAFYDDPAAGSMFVFAAPEAEALAAKLVSSIEAERSSREVTFACSAQFVDAAGYYAAAAQSIIENMLEHADALRQEGIEFELPAAMDVELENVSSEHLFADFVERVSRALYPRVARRTVVLLRAEPPSEGTAPANFVGSVSQLGALVCPERTKFVLFVDPSVPYTATAPAVQRMSVVAPKTGKQQLETLHGFFARPARRVLVLHTAHVAVKDDSAALASVAFEAGYPARVLPISLEPAPLRRLAEQACSALRALASQRRVTLPKEAAKLSPIDQFAQLCESWAGSAEESYENCLVVLRLQKFEQRDLALGRELVVLLNRAACSLRVRYIVLDDSYNGVLPVMEEAPRRVAAMRVEPDAASLEGGLSDKLSDPALPIPERIRCLSGLAAIATSRKDHAAALALHDQALGLSEQTNDPATSFLVWLGIGQTFYRASAWDSAQSAFSKALSVSLDAQLAAGIAQSTLSLADALLCGANLEDAEACYQSAIAWYDKLGAPLFACHALTWLGEAQRRGKKIDLATNTWNDTLQRYDALGPDFRDAVLEGKKQVLGRLARLDEERKDQAAVKRHQHALSALGSAPVLTEVP